MAKEINTEKQAEVVVDAVSKFEAFLKKYQTVIYSVIGAIVVIGVAFFCYHRFVYVPAVEEAQAQMATAEANFAAKEYDLALNGDGNAMGFGEIIDEYGSKAGAAVYLYAGICEYHAANYDQAISYLKSYKGKDSILSARALACIGDCYVAKEDLKAGLDWYKKAATTADNMFAATYLLKAGVVAEELGDSALALGFYKQIKDKYPQSIEGYDIDKYISRISK